MAITLQDLIVAFGLVFFIEGVLYAVMASRVKRFMQVIMTQDESTLRQAGLFAALFGLTVVWLARTQL